MPPCALALDCTTARGSAALADTASGAILWRTDFPAGRGQGGLLFAALETALRQISDPGQTPALGEIVVGLGPGSYSGVRQAIAACVGLSLSTGASLFGVPSSAALETDAPAYQAIGDARRGTFYYTAVENGVCVVEPELLEQPALLARVAARPGWPIFIDAPLPPELSTLFHPAAPTVALPLAERLLTAPPAARKLPPLEPIYLRAPSITLPKPRP